MRVLLYETGERGHRGLYRGYYELALRSVGVDVQVHSTPSFEGLFSFNQHLQALAKEFECKVIHLLTMDDHTKRLLLSKKPAAVSQAAPVVATYYLYQNLQHPVKGLLLRKLLLDRKVTALIVPTAMQLLSPQIFRSYLPRIHAIPDPVDAYGGNAPTKLQALRKLGLPEVWESCTVVLVFGVLNRRRGVDEIVRMLQSSTLDSTSVRFIFAGRLDRSSLDVRTLDALRAMKERGFAHVLDTWLSSDEVNEVFACADIFCIAPQKQFQGASSTVAQAIARGLTIIAPSDSVAGQCARAKHCGLLFRRGNVSDFARCLNLGAQHRRVKSRQMQTAQDACPLFTDLHDFGRRLATIYAQTQWFTATQPKMPCKAEARHL